MIHKQSINQPLFPEIEWESPQNIRQKGELLIVGGSPHGFASIANSYEYTSKAGIGHAKVAMPSSTEQTVKGFIENAAFLPSTPSGSFSKRGLTDLKSYAQEAWGTLLAGDFGRNSETASLIEGFMMSTTGKIIITKDAADYAATSYPRPILMRKNTLLVASLSQLQKLLKNANFTDNIRFEMSINETAKLLESISKQIELKIVIFHHNHIYAAIDGSVSLTPIALADSGLWQTKTASFATVFWLQHDAKEFEGITTGIYESLR